MVTWRQRRLHEDRQRSLLSFPLLERGKKQTVHPLISHTSQGGLISSSVKCQNRSSQNRSSQPHPQASFDVDQMVPISSIHLNHAQLPLEHARHKRAQRASPGAPTHK